MKVCPRCLSLTLLFLLGFVATVAGCWGKSHFSDRDMLQHCTNINKGEILPYPKGCAKPVNIKDDIFTFINTDGKKEHYVIVKKRNGEFHYYEITRS